MMNRGILIRLCLAMVIMLSVGILAFGHSKAQATTCDDLVNEGRQALINKDLVLANSKFSQALDCDPNNPTANSFYAATRLMVLVHSSQANTLMTRFGISSTGRDLYNWTADFQRDVEGNIILPSNSPTVDDLISFFINTVLPEIEEATANLNILNSSFNLLLSQDEIQTDIAMEADYGDIASFKCGLELVKAFFKILNSYNLILDIDEFIGRIENGDINNINSFFGFYSNLFTLKSGAAAQLAEAKIALINAYNNYLTTSSFILAETDDQSDDIIVIDPDEHTNEAEFRARLVEFHSALSGPAMINVNEPFRLDLSRFFDVPLDIRRNLPIFNQYNIPIYRSLPDPTFNGLFPDFTQEWWGRSFSLPNKYFVNVATGSDSNVGDTPTTALKTISEAVNRSRYGVVRISPVIIEVAAGTYNLASGENFPIDLPTRVILRGDGAATTTIDASGAGNSVVELYYDSTLTGFTITGGNNNRSGGIYANSSTISNCIVTGNTATSWGGGIYAFYSLIKNCTIRNNSAINAGGIYIYNSTIKNSLISGNSASGSFSSYGGGIYAYSSSAITNCTITGNSASASSSASSAYSHGGGIYAYSSPIKNCVITGNSVSASSSASSAYSYGGGIYADSITVTNCTITGNSASGTSSSYGGGIYAQSVIVTNSIFWNDTAGGSPNEVYLASSTAPGNISYSDIDPSLITGYGTPGLTNNINADPLFVGSTDYHLQSGSLCIDAGTSSGAPSYDIEGTLRPDGGGYDMGAYEYCINGFTVWYKDADDDSYSDGTSLTQCKRPAGYKLSIELTATTGDCDDNDYETNPGTIWYKDADGDWYSDGTSLTQCAAPTDYKLSWYIADINGDCDESNPAIYLGAVEICNIVDDNCNGLVDEGLATITYYQDADGDGYGNAAVTQDACSAPAGYVTDNTDCDDTDAARYPGNTEVCDGKDNNCDGAVPANEADADGDGYRVCQNDCNDSDSAVHPGAAETCNGVDDDCDGNIDSLSLYADDFSTGADGWQESNKIGNPEAETDDSQNFQDAGQQALSLKESDTDSIAYTLDYDGESFTMTYDLYIRELVSGSTPGFSLTTDPVSPLKGLSYIAVLYSLGENHPVMTVEGFSGRIERNNFKDENLAQTLLNNQVLYAAELSPEYVFFNSDIESQEQLSARLGGLGIVEVDAILGLWNRSLTEGSFIEEFQPKEIEGSWWHHKISYNEETWQVRVVISRGKGGSDEIVVEKTYEVMNGFSEEMIYLVLSHHPWDDSGAASTSYVDNVQIQSVCTSPLPPEDDDDDSKEWYECSVGSGPHPFTLSSAVNMLIFILPFGAIAFQRRYFS